jgi:predicted NAD/FAD-binding protein/DUF1365 family protein
MPGNVAVVGSGVAGLLAAHVLAKHCRVTLYEADTRLGGHADTHVVDGGGTSMGIDTGFIVHNERTYPQLLRLFAELGVETQDSEMSMSVRDDVLGLEYAGALGASGLFPTWGNLARPAYLRMLVEIPRFHRMARRLLEHDAAQGAAGDLEPLRDFLERGRFSPMFRTHFMEPLVACVWSSDPAVALDYPARYLFTFLAHHGMLGVRGSPTWRTVTGGSKEYVARVAARLDDVRVGTKVTSLLERPDGVEVTDGNGEVATYDAVVVATHPHQALAMLAEPTAVQREVLAAITYSPNITQLHTDESLLPRARRARASWNYLRRPDDHPPGPHGAVTVTYDLTRLMRLPAATAGPHAGKRFLVTLGGADLVDPGCVIDTMEYEHPLYTPSSVGAQWRLPECDSDRVVFAGAWHGWGFHEDGARSGVAAAARLGAPWTDDSDAAPRTTRSGIHTPAQYDSTIVHIRRRPWRRRFTQRTRTWLVDLDALPDHGILGRFEARDHLGDPDRPIRENVARFLSLHGIAVDSPERGRGRVRMAANARALGFCFNPISVHWCHAGDGELLAVVVEVHNTYGDRHTYLVHPDEQGRASTDKAMYVSPFHGTDGRYELAVPVPGERLELAITLHTGDPDGRAAFTATLGGPRASYSPRRAAPAALRGWLQIHAHGVWLWARRLPVRPRPEHPRQEGVR